LESSIFANRTAYPFKMTVPALPDPPVGSADQILVAPNPFVVGEGRSQPAEGEELLFVNIPNPCTIRIYTVRGDLVKTIEVPVGFGGIARWDLGSEYGQFVKSGVYIYHVDSPKLTKIGKFAVVK
jgi:hypothetical protein